MGVHISIAHRAGGDRDALEQFEHGRAGDRDDAVRAAGRPAAERDRRGVQPVEAEVLEPGHDADDVGQRVQRADLVEVHGLRLDPVHPALGDREPLEHGERALADGGGQVGVEQQRADVGPGAVLGRLGRLDVHPGGAEAMAGDLLGNQADALDRQRGDGGGRHVEGNPGVDQRAEQHVARRPRGEIEPADGHAVIMPSRRDRRCSPR